MAELKIAQPSDDRELNVALVSEDTTAWLNVLLESQQRKDELIRMRAQVAAQTSAYHTITQEYEREMAKKNQAIIEERSTAQRRLNQLIVCARALCPILRQFLLMKGAMPVSGLLPCGDEHERNAKEMLIVLGAYEKM